MKRRRVTISNARSSVDAVRKRGPPTHLFQLPPLALPAISVPSRRFQFLVLALELRDAVLEHRELVLVRRADLVERLAFPLFKGK